MVAHLAVLSKVLLNKVLEKPNPILPRPSVPRPKLVPGEDACKSWGVELGTINVYGARWSKDNLSAEGDTLTTNLFTIFFLAHALSSSWLAKVFSIMQ